MAGLPAFANYTVHPWQKRLSSLTGTAFTAGLALHPGGLALSFPLASSGLQECQRRLTSILCLSANPTHHCLTDLPKILISCQPSHIPGPTCPTYPPCYISSNPSSVPTCSQHTHVGSHSPPSIVSRRAPSSSLLCLPLAFTGCTLAGLYLDYSWDPEAL